MAWRIGKSKTTVELPQEVQEYYQGERRERTGVAWLLALGTLIVTLAVAFGLFWTGRWVYRTVAGDDNKKTPTIAQPASPASPASPTGTSSTKTTTPSSSQPATGTNSSNPAVSTATPTAMPNTGQSSPTVLPNTGETEE